MKKFLFHWYALVFLAMRSRLILPDITNLVKLAINTFINKPLAKLWAYVVGKIDGSYRGLR
ncbi:hypothetical protein F8G27_00945 [Campylobacter upsaliensis]|nr:hypothetical protein [Campylobacter upsaliensis]